MEKKSNKRLIFGILLVLFGSVIIINNLGLIPLCIEPYIFSWKTLLITIGVLGLMFKSSKTTSIILISIGAFFMLPDIFNIPIETRKLFWPTIFIVIGLIIILQGKKMKNHFSQHQEAIDDEGTVDVMAIFGGSKRIIRNKNFAGGKVTSIFGGTEIDLTNAELHETGGILDLFNIFGGLKLIVPNDMEVQVEVISILGGFHDKRPQSKVMDPIENKKTLRIQGIVIFGGGEIKSY